ncbi:MAG: SDR family oxidoreductase [Planctomycetia bacterium]|jgi:NAD(P)-dependent dehydrogenase (short-subunit alcohol dehydrogenase family)|nr:SDR family oxidoreductase [Planctomycetia bacterium]
MAIKIDLADRRALVTGVSSGIGAAIAKVLATAGCDVCGCGTRSADSFEANQFQKSVEQMGRRAFYLQTDLRYSGQLRTFTTQAAQCLGGIDLLISNAGRNVFCGVEGCTDADWNDCMELDLASHWRLCQATAGNLRSGRSPVIIIISSNHAYSTIPGCFPYNVAKAGLAAMVQSLAIELGPVIRTVGIAPGFIDTPGNDRWFQSFPDATAERRRTENLHPVHRLGSPEEIGAFCAFLASDHAAFMTGVTVLIDGGRSALMQDPNL